MDYNNEKHMKFSSELLKEIGDWIFKLELDGDRRAKLFIEFLTNKNIDNTKVFGDIFSWMKDKATHEKDSMALYFVGRCYLEGELVQKDCEVGIENLKKSSEQGNADAFYLLGNYYRDKSNNEETLKCYREAEKLGHELASTAIKLLSLHCD